VSLPAGSWRSKLMSYTLIPLFALFAVMTFRVTVCGQINVKPLRASDQVKAETLISRLEELNRNPDLLGNREFLRSISRNTITLPEGDIKTNIATAVHWYERALMTEGVALNCYRERPGFYRQLCETSKDRGDLSRAKARLHSMWAKALVNADRGLVDAVLLDQLALERKNDYQVARRLIESLRLLEAEVISYDSLGDFEESGRLARVPFEVFTRDLHKISADAEMMLSWLPHNRMKNEIRNALSSYQDGGFWWAKIYQPRVINVLSLRSFESTRTTADDAYFASTPYTIVINWRHGSRYLKRAEELLRQQAPIDQNEAFMDLAGGVVVREN